MKKITLIWAALFALALTGCNESSDPQEGNETVVGIAGKTLVTKISIKRDHKEEGSSSYQDWTWTETEKVDGTLNFSYKDGKLTAMSGDVAYHYFYEENDEGEYDKEEVDGNGSISVKFSYQGSDMLMDFYANTSANGTTAGISGDYVFKMNASNAIQSGKGTLGSDEEEIICTYDEADYLQSRWYDDDMDDKIDFKWSDGNLVQYGWYWNYEKKQLKSPLLRKMKQKGVRWEDVGIRYSSKDNKSNLDFAYVCFLFGLDPEGIGELLGMLGFMGKESKNLPDAIYYEDEDFYTFKYKFNNDGLVTQMEIMDVEYNELCLTIKFSY